MLNSAKNRKINVSFSKDEFIKLWDNQKQECFYCKRPLEKIQNENGINRGKRLTVDRINNRKGYELDNIVLSCFRCNRIKSDYFTKKEILKIGKIIFEKSL